MTQDEIKEALETCILGYCTGCPYDGCDGDCRDELHKDVLTLITEQEKSIQMAQDQILFVAQQNQEYREQQVKQAKIDMLNRIMTYINNKIEAEYGDMSDSVNYLTIDIDDFDDFIDKLIKEVER